MKKTYDSPEFELVKLIAADVICDSRTESGAGGGSWGDSGEFGGEGSESGSD